MAGGKIPSQRKRQRLKRQREKQAAQQAHDEQSAVDPRGQPGDDGRGSGGDDDSQYGPNGHLPARTEAQLLERAVRNGWLTDGQTQRFETRTSENELASRVNSQSGEASAMELASLELLQCLKSPNRRLKMIAIRTLTQMEKLNQRDEEFEEELSLKKAIVEQRGGHGDESTPTGVILLSRPCTSVEEWQAEVAADLASEQQATEAEHNLHCE